MIPKSAFRAAIRRTAASLRGRMSATECWRPRPRSWFRR